jgi:hypothetical protein
VFFVGHSWLSSHFTTSNTIAGCFCNHGTLSSPFTQLPELGSHLLPLGQQCNLSSQHSAYKKSNSNISIEGLLCHETIRSKNHSIIIIIGIIFLITGTVIRDIIKGESNSHLLPLY